MALLSISAPMSPSSKLRCHTRHTPAPAPSRSNGGLSGKARMLPSASVMTQAELVPSASVRVTSNGSAMPSPAQIVNAVSPPAVANVPPFTPFLVTVMGLDRSKQPCKSPAFIPSSAPVRPSSKLRCQIKQTPLPAPSKSKGGPSGKPRILPSTSVMTHAELVPSLSVRLTSKASLTPSPAQIVNSVVPSAIDKSPPLTPLRITVIGLERSKQPCKSAAFKPTIAPVRPSSKLRCQMRQVPPPAPSRSKGGPAGSARIFPSGSVMTHAELVPSSPVRITSKASLMPSPAQIVNSITLSAVVNYPPSTPLLATLIGLERAKHPVRSLALRPTSKPIRPSS